MVGLEPVVWLIAFCWFEVSELEGGDEFGLTGVAVAIQSDVGDAEALHQVDGLLDSLSVCAGLEACLSAGCVWHVELRWVLQTVCSFVGCMQLEDWDLLVCVCHDVDLLVVGFGLACG